MVQPCPVTPMKPGEAFRTGFDHRLESTTRPHRDFPFSGMRKRMELEQVDRVHPQPVEGAPDLVTRGLIRPLPGLRRQEEVIAVRMHPRPDSKFRVAVAGCGVDMVHAVFEQ